MVAPIAAPSPRRFRIDWVLIDALAVGPAPRAERHLQRLHDAGIRAVFSLCSNEEAPAPAGLEERFCCKRLVLPDHRSADVLELGQLEDALQQLAALRQVGPVFVHCVAAMERSPLVCMAWLVQTQALSPTEALDYLMQVHPGTNPLPRQLALLRQLNRVGVAA
jgi:hypothetical protein